MAKLTKSTSQNIPVLPDTTNISDEQNILFLDRFKTEFNTLYNRIIQTENSIHELNSKYNEIYSRQQSETQNTQQAVSSLSSQVGYIEEEQDNMIDWIISPSSSLSSEESSSDESSGSEQSSSDSSEESSSSSGESSSSSGGGGGETSSSSSSESQSWTCPYCDTTFSSYEEAITAYPAGNFICDECGNIFEGQESVCSACGAHVAFEGYCSTCKAWRPADNPA